MDLSILHRKESLILTTIDLIDKKGLYAVSTREIAKSQGISEAAIFKHFANKNDLLIGVLDYFSKYDGDIFNTTYVRKMKPVDSILFSFRSFATYYENYPAITSILLSLESMRYDINLKPKVDSIIQSRDSFLRNHIGEGVKQGEIKSDLSCEIITDILSGTGKEISVRWRREGYSFALCESVMSAIQTILKRLS